MANVRPEFTERTITLHRFIYQPVTALMPQAEDLRLLTSIFTALMPQAEDLWLQDLRLLTTDN